MTNQDLGVGLDIFPPDLRIGTPERKVARDALKTHLQAGRIDSVEYDQRWATCQSARTQAELLQVFADLPAPRPVPGATGCDGDDEDPPPLAVAVMILLLGGLPVGAVLGATYDAWWALAVPVALSVKMVYAEHLRTRAGDRADQQR